MKVKLTKKYVDSLPFSDKTEYHQDLELTGFAVRVGKKTKQYMVNKRIDNVLQRIVISETHLMTITEARDEAMRIMADIKKGIDPKAKPPTEAPPIKIPTLKECLDYFLANKTLTEKTIETYTWQVESLLKEWNKLPLNDITKTMIAEKHAKLTKRSPAQANASMRTLRSIWNYCRHSFLDENEDFVIKECPVAILSVKKDWNVIKPKKRHVEEENLKPYLLSLLNHLDSSSHRQAPHSNNARDIVLTFMLTGVRLNEAQRLRWENIDLKIGKIDFLKTKNGSDYPLPMGKVLWAMMKHRKKYSQGNEWVFPSEFVKKDTHVKELSASYKNIANKAGLHITPHDLRRTFASVANRLSMTYPVLKKLLNHQDAKTADEVTLHYIQISQNEIRQALNDIEVAYFGKIGMTQDEVIEKYFKD